MAGPFEDALRRSLMAPGSTAPPNPRTFPVRPIAEVDDEVRRADQQHADLVATMAATGQAGALVIATLQALRPSSQGACTVTTWSEGPTSVLPVADVVIIFELPPTVEAVPRTTWVRWDVVERVCGRTCWQAVPGLDPTRLITRRWPSSDQLDILHRLRLPELPGTS